MKGLTSKQHLFLRVILVVTLANAAIYYNLFLNLQVVTVPQLFVEFAVFSTAITLFALTVNLLFWWKYQRRADNLRFWGTMSLIQSVRNRKGRQLLNSQQ